MSPACEGVRAGSPRAAIPMAPPAHATMLVFASCRIPPLVLVSVIGYVRGGAVLSSPSACRQMLCPLWRDMMLGSSFFVWTYRLQGITTAPAAW